jgi:hypothetical protein
MVGRYELAYACESAEVAALLGALKPKQRRVLREYVWRVELGETGVTEWLRSEDCPVGERAWYDKGPKAAYFHNSLFQTALQAYLRVAGGWQVREEEKAVGAARRELRMAAPKAARRLAWLIENAESHSVQEKASEAILDRADVGTAPKAEVELTDARERLARLLGADTAEDADPAGAGQAER